MENSWRTDAKAMEIVLAGKQRCNTYEERVGCGAASRPFCTLV
jgi:hypothetical protein